MKALISSTIIVLVTQATAIAAGSAKGGPEFMSEPFPSEFIEATGFGAGHDFTRLAVAAARIPPKDDFESASTYSARVALAGSASGYANVHLTDRLLKTGLLGSVKDGYGEVTSEYDAEKGEFRLCLMFSTILGYPSVQGTPVKISTSTKPLGSYVGTNAFGVRTTVKKSATSILQLVVDVSVMDPRCYPTVRMTPEEARAIATGTLWGLVGHLKPPYVETSEMDFSPTINDPFEQHLVMRSMPFKIEEIIAFNGRTGVIHYRATRSRALRE